MENSCPGNFTNDRNLIKLLKIYVKSMKIAKKVPIIQGFSNSVKGWGKPLPYNKKIPSKFSIPPIWKGCLLGRIDTYKISTYNGELLDFMKENFKRNLNISGLKLTLKNCTVLRKSKGSEQKSLPQVNFFSHLHSDFQFFTIHNSKLVFLLFFF